MPHSVIGVKPCTGDNPFRIFFGFVENPKWVLALTLFHNDWLAPTSLNALGKAHELGQGRQRHFELSRMAGRRPRFRKIPLTAEIQFTTLRTVSQLSLDQSS